MRKEYESSVVFRTVSEFNKEYKDIRSKVLKRHGFKDGDKVRLNGVVQLMKSWDGKNFMNYTKVVTDMKQDIKKEEMFGNGKVYYKLVSLA